MGGLSVYDGGKGPVRVSDHPSASRKVSWASESADEGSQRLPKRLKFVILLASVYDLSCNHLELHIYPWTFF